ncbi:uncharacterized protein LOC124163773 [Ischnura elegans]|uniref:uncharacterized protein LOC124163773 n=1 Tax=Ischnura elegans TaxID=197161 RepID=UPI001ED87747|nr:uncharacterized protein LOC124163773 [Ischnura elegans]
MSSLAFLQCCRDSNTLPSCVNVKHHINTPATKGILRRTSEAFVRERVHHTRGALHFCSKEIYKAHMELSNILTTADWDTIYKIIYEPSRITQATVRETQIKKFEKLSSGQHPVHGPEKGRSVFNLMDETLDFATESILAKGFNFVIAPKAIRKEKIITGVESAIRKLPKAIADEIREDVGSILRKSRPPRPNITAAERRALRKLQDNGNILILPADKGNAAVLMRTEDYEKKISSLLQEQTYRKMKADPTSKLERNTRAIIKSSSIPKEYQRGLLPSAAKPPRLYGIPKIHK